MNLGLLGAIGGLGQGLSQAGSSLFEEELQRRKEERLQAIRDKEYARDRADTLTDQKTKFDFDADQAQKDRDANTARYGEAYKTDLERLQERRQGLLESGADPESQEIKEINAAIQVETTRGSSQTSSWDTFGRMYNTVNDTAVALVEAGEFESIADARQSEIAKLPQAYQSMFQGFSGGQPAAPTNDEPPEKGARKAPDGNWYIVNPDYPEKSDKPYLRVDR